MDELTDRSRLWHRLYNPLGLILANAELLEEKATDQRTRSRATQVVAGAVEAFRMAREIRSKLEPPTDDSP